ncbi:MAG: Ig-like domain-containing protein [Odoribacter sp.]|nr:Ig-like domain-containing protein [Odoribacter sp.]
MSGNNQHNFSWSWSGPVLWALLVYACANRGYPEGGPKDTTPPEVVAEVPVSFSKNFDKKRVNIYFNEFVQLKDVNEKFIFSPPLKKNPRVSLRGKYIQVSIGDTLKPNTTYSMDFADAIVDNNEGNPLGYYRYVFSTGNVIDTLEIGGKVVNAESYEPVLNAMVALYEDHADSVPLLRLPDYIARTDSSGNFRFTNLRDAVYRVAAIEDNNKDKKYTPESEWFAFLDSTVHPVVMPMTRSDTFRLIEQIVNNDTLYRDSIVHTEYLGFGPSNLYLRIFQEKLTQLYLVDDERKERERLNFVFSIPGKNDLQVRLWDTLATEPFPENWYFSEHNAGNDTISLWIKDSTIYKKDTLNVILSYLRSDSTGQHSLYTDTTRYTFRKKKKTEVKGKQKEDQEPKVEFLEILSNVSGDMDLGSRMYLEFKRPVDKSGLKDMRLSEGVDTVFRSIPFELEEDSLKIRRVYVDADWKPGTSYRLELDSATVFDIYGRFNDKLEKKFKVRTEEYYGKVTLSLKGVTSPTIVQVYKSEGGKSDNGKRKYNIFREKTVSGDGDVIFNLLPEGKYKFRAIRDVNGNGVWDTGLYLKNRQPEEIVYLPIEISVKQNFDYEQEFDLNQVAE